MSPWVPLCLLLVGVNLGGLSGTFVSCCLHGGGSCLRLRLDSSLSSRCCRENTLGLPLHDVEIQVVKVTYFEVVVVVVVEL